MGRTYVRAPNRVKIDYLALSTTALLRSLTTWTESATAMGHGHGTRQRRLELAWPWVSLTRQASACCPTSPRPASETRRPDGSTSTTNRVRKPRGLI